MGPCLGIYVRVNSSRRRPFGEQTQLLAEISRLAAQRDVDVVVLGPGYTKSGRGWRYDEEQKQWLQVFVATPDIVYRRSGAFTSTDVPLVKEDMAMFMKAGLLHTLPRTFSNKWKLHQVLSKYRKVKPYLLETALVSSAEEIFKYVSERQDVYVKPLTGSQGRQIYRMRRTPAGLAVSWQGSGRNLSPRPLEQRLFMQARAFHSFWLANGPQRCIAQETFVLPQTREGHPFDLRWLVQYPDAATACVTARVARVGDAGSVTTNIHTGAKPMAAESLLSHNKWPKYRNVLEEVDDVALRVTEACRSEYGPIAELGVDLAVNLAGDIRVFEINPTPGRRMLRLLSPELRELSLQYLLEYAINAAGFGAET